MYAIYFYLLMIGGTQLTLGRVALAPQGVARLAHEKNLEGDKIGPEYPESWQ